MQKKAETMRRHGNYIKYLLKHMWAVGISVMGVLILLIVISNISEDKNEAWVGYLSKYANDDLDLICHHEDCVYVTENESYYAPIDGELKPVSEKSIHELPLYHYLEFMGENIPGTNAVVYSYAWERTIPILIYVALGLMTIFIIMLSRRLHNVIDQYEADTVNILQNSAALENNLKIIVAATAHHEMLTPIEVIKTTIRDIRHSCGFCALSGSQKLFDRLNTSIGRLESVLAQMASDRKQYKREKSPILDIIETTLDSLQVIHTEFNFNFSINNKELLSRYTNYKLDSGTICNMVTNLFKNSLEAGANLITVCGYNENGALSLVIMDNGHGIPQDYYERNADIFELGKSSKQIDIGLIEANQKIKSTGDVRGNGLFLVKAILDSVGGSITLLKTSTVGTAFKLTFPVSKIDRSENEN